MVTEREDVENKVSDLFHFRAGRIISSQQKGIFHVETQACPHDHKLFNNTER
jgi:hypothetical protein